jgi:DNA-binding MarR family transcriptional regulator
MELAASTGLSQKLLAERLRLEKSSVSRLVVRLGEKGWVRRDPDPVDRRSTLVRLTARGHRTAEQMGKARAEKFRVLYEALSEEERAAVSGALGTLVRAIEGRHAGAPAIARKENKR